MTNAGDEGVRCGADDCGESLAVMKQCTRCRSIFYVSPAASPLPRSWLSMT